MSPIDLAHLTKFPGGHDAAGIGELQLACFVAALGDVDAAVAHIADGYAAPGILPEILHELIRDEAPLVTGEEAAGRGLLQVVLEENAPDLKGLEYMGVFRSPIVLPFCQARSSAARLPVR
jgi:hypothetical protein